MSFDFSPGETDNALYAADVRDMDRKELTQAYTDMMRCRGEGGDISYSLQMCIDIIKSSASQREYFELPKLPEDHTISGYIKQVDTPTSSSIDGYGYDFYEHTLYVKYRSNGKVYAFYKVPLEEYNNFEASESKGKYAAIIRKRFGTKSFEG